MPGVLVNQVLTYKHTHAKLCSRSSRCSHGPHLAAALSMCRSAESAAASAPMVRSAPSSRFCHGLISSLLLRRMRASMSLSAAPQLAATQDSPSPGTGARYRPCSPGGAAVQDGTVVQVWCSGPQYSTIHGTGVRYSSGSVSHCQAS